MFGLESGEKKKKEIFVFELEKEFKDPESQAKLKKRIHERLFDIKKRLQKGVKDEEYHFLAKLVFGYSSFIKVMNVCLSKK